jgi:hypothetical protein
VGCAPCRAVVTAKDEIAWRAANREGGEEFLALIVQGDMPGLVGLRNPNLDGAGVAAEV